MQLVRPGRQVQQLLGERLGEGLEHVDRTDDADEHAVVVDERHVPEAAGLHELDRAPDRLVEVERVRVVDHQALDRLARGPRPGSTRRPKMSRSVSTPSRRPFGSVTNTESAVPAVSDQVEARLERRARGARSVGRAG